MPKDKPSQESWIERERRHVNREDDPNFDPTDKLPGDKIPGADQTPAEIDPIDSKKKVPTRV